MVKTDIVIPVRDQLHLTQSIVEQLQHMNGWHHCHIFDNGSVDGTWEYLESLDPNEFTIYLAPEVTIYEMWDWGFYRARHFHNAGHVAFLNNDVKLHPNTIMALNEALKADENNWLAYPDYNWNRPAMANLCNYKVTKGTYRHGGMSGFAFMLKAGKVNWEPLVDHQFIHWGGDDDIAFEVEKRGGKQVRVVGLPIEHMNEGTARHYDLGAQKAADLQNVIKKWGR